MKGDIQSLDLVLHVLKTEEVDTVMHFAAQVGPSYHHYLKLHSYKGKVSFNPGRMKDSKYQRRAIRCPQRGGSI